MSGEALYAYTGSPASIANLPNDMKIVYEEGVQLQFVKQTKPYALVSKNKRKFSGKQKTFYAMGEEGGNYNAIAENGYARSPSIRDGVLGTVNIPGYQVYTVATSIPMEENEKGGAVFMKTADKVKMATESLQRHIGRQFYGDGTCTLCKISTLNGGNGYSQDITIDTTVAAKTTRWMRKYDTVSAWAATTGDLRNATVGIVGQVKTQTTWRCTSDTTWAPQTDYVTFADNRAYSGTEYYHEMIGLGAVTSTSSTFEDISPSTAGNEFWKGVNYTNSGTLRDFDFSYIWDAFASIQSNGGTGEFVLYCSPEMIRPWNEIMSGQVRIDQSKQGTISMRPLTAELANANGNGVITITPEMDWLCPPGDFYMFPVNSFGMLVEIDLKFLDKEMLTRIPRTLYKEGQLCFAGQTYITQRNHFAKIGDFNYTLISMTRG